MASVTSSSNNPPTNVTTGGGQSAPVDPAAGGSVTSPVDPTAWLVAVLYYLAQSGVHIPAWVYQAISIELQASAGTSSNGSHGGIQSFLTGSALDSNEANSAFSAQSAASSNSVHSSSLVDPLASSFPGTQPQSSASLGGNSGPDANGGLSSSSSLAAPTTTSAGAGGATGSAAGAAGNQSQPFVYTDPLGLNAAFSSAQNSLSQLSSNDALFNSWAALLSPPLAASQTLLTAPDQNSVSNLLAVAANNSTQHASVGGA